MANGSGNCPRCGIKFNARESSIGTVRRCEACGFKFVLHAAPVMGCTGCLTTLLATTAVIGVLMALCCAGFIFLSGVATTIQPSPKPTPIARVPANVAKAHDDVMSQAADQPPELMTDFETKPAANARMWADKTGKFTTEARFGGMTGSVVTLHKTDGATLKIQLDQLSDADREWIEARRKGDKKHAAVKTPQLPQSRSSQREWYQGGTLHHAKMREWRSADYANKLATAADLISKQLQIDGTTVASIDIEGTMRPAAVELVKGVDAAGKDGIADDKAVTEVVATIFASMNAGKR